MASRRKEKSKVSERKNEVATNRLMERAEKKNQAIFLSRGSRRERKKRRGTVEGHWREKRFQKKFSVI